MKSFFATICLAVGILVSHHGMVRLAAAFSPPMPTSPYRGTILSKRASPTALSGVRSAVRRVFRRKVRTLETEAPDTTTDEPKEPERMYRLVYYDSCDYQPEGVARVLAKLVPSLDRRTAYHLCSHARMAGKVPLLVTDRNNAERYCAILLQYGLKATVEPHGTVVSK